MSTIMEEIPGARERPVDCPVLITREDDGTTILAISPRGVSPLILFFSALLLANLLTTLYTGIVLLLRHRSVLFMSQISPGGLPVSLNHYDTWLWLALVLAEGLGFFTLAVILRYYV